MTPRFATEYPGEAGQAARMRQRSRMCNAPDSTPFRVSSQRRYIVGRTYTPFNSSTTKVEIVYRTDSITRAMERAQHRDPSSWFVIDSAANRIVWPLRGDRP
jgi:hypothetical protein